MAWHGTARNSRKASWFSRRLSHALMAARPAIHTGAKAWRPAANAGLLVLLGLPHTLMAAL